MIGRWAKCFIDMCNARWYVRCQMKRMSRNIFYTHTQHTLHGYDTAWLSPNTSFDLMLIYGIAKDMGRHTRYHACEHRQSPHVHQPVVFSFRLSVFQLDGWLSRSLCKTISVPSRGGHWEITKCRLHHELVVHTCDLVVAYIHIHMLLMPGINNVLHFARTSTHIHTCSQRAHTQRNDDGKKILENPVELNQHSTPRWVAPSENLLFSVFFFWLQRQHPKVPPKCICITLPCCFGVDKRHRVRKRKSVCVAVCLWYIKIAWEIPPKNTK